MGTCKMNNIDLFYRESRNKEIESYVDGVTGEKRLC